jgi:hypothetical protein
MPVEMCPGVSVPVVAVDQVCSFRKTDIVDWWPEPPPKKSKSRRSAANGSIPPDPEKLFNMLVQSADNLGDTDAWRALNFLSVRYQPIYEKYTWRAETIGIYSYL